MSDYIVIPSPCIGVCRLSEQGVCVGCYRHVDEITYWRLYSTEEREEALQRVEQRREQQQKT